jgi:predicted aspartyl protease
MLFLFMVKRVTTISIDHILIEDDGSHVLIKAKINGKVARLLIDTGASRSVFDLERIRQFVNEKSFPEHNKLSTGLGTNSMPTSTITLKSLKIGDLTIENFPAVLLDLQHVNGTYDTLGHSAIDGVIGNDILVMYNALINYKKMSLTLSMKRNKK